MSKIILKLMTLISLVAISMARNTFTGKKNNGGIVKKPTRRFFPKFAEIECQDRDYAFAIVKQLAKKEKLSLPPSAKLGTCLTSRTENLNNHKVELNIEGTTCHLSIFSSKDLSNNGKIKFEEESAQALKTCLQNAHEAQSALTVDESEESSVEEENSTEGRYEEIDINEEDDEEEEQTISPMAYKLYCDSHSKKIHQLFERKANEIKMTLPKYVEISNCFGKPSLTDATYTLQFKRENMKCSISLNTVVTEDDEYAFASEEERKRFVKEVYACDKYFDPMVDISGLYDLETNSDIDVEELAREKLPDCISNDAFDYFTAKFRANYSKTADIKQLKCKMDTKSTNFRRRLLTVNIDSIICEVDFRYKSGKNDVALDSQMQVMFNDQLTKCGEKFNESNRLKEDAEAQKRTQAKKNKRDKQKRAKLNQKNTLTESPSLIDQTIEEKIIVDEQSNDIVEDVQEEETVPEKTQEYVEVCSDNNDYQLVEDSLKISGGENHQFTRLECLRYPNDKLYRKKTVKVAVDGVECDFEIRVERFAPSYKLKGNNELSFNNDVDRCVARVKEIKEQKEAKKRHDKRKRNAANKAVFDQAFSELANMYEEPLVQNDVAEDKTQNFDQEVELLPVVQEEEEEVQVAQKEVDEQIKSEFNDECFGTESFKKFKQIYKTSHTSSNNVSLVSCFNSNQDSEFRRKQLSVTINGAPCTFVLLEKKGVNTVQFTKANESYLKDQIKECDASIKERLNNGANFTDPANTQKNRDKKLRKAAAKQRKNQGPTMATLEEPEAAKVNEESNHINDMIVRIGAFEDSDFNTAISTYNYFVVNNLLEGKIIYTQNVVSVQTQVVDGENISVVLSFNGKKCQLNAFRGINKKYFLYRENFTANERNNQYFMTNRSNMPFKYDNCVDVHGTTMASELLKL